MPFSLVSSSECTIHGEEMWKAVPEIAHFPPLYCWVVRGPDLRPYFAVQQHSSKVTSPRARAFIKPKLWICQRSTGLEDRRAAQCCSHFTATHMPLLCSQTANNKRPPHTRISVVHLPMVLYAQCTSGMHLERCCTVVALTGTPPCAVVPPVPRMQHSSTAL